MNPGLLPVLWIEVPPRRQAASTRARTDGSMPGGCWNSPRVVTTLAPDSSRRHTSSKSQLCGMYSTQSAPRARISSIESVARTPVGPPRPHRSPASRPTLSGEYTYRPDQRHVRVLDDPAQRAGADVAGGPLHHPVVALTLGFSPFLGQRGLVQHVGGQPHVGGVHELPVPTDGTHPVGLRRCGRSAMDARASSISWAVGANTSLAMAIWSGWIAHLPSKPSRLACTAARRIALGVLVGRVRRVDGVDAGARAAARTWTRAKCQKSPGYSLTGSKLPSTRARSEAERSPAPKMIASSRSLAPAISAALRQPLGLLDEHLEADAFGQAELGLQLGEEHVDPPDVAGRAAPWAR